MLRVVFNAVGRSIRAPACVINCLINTNIRELQKHSFGKLEPETQSLKRIDKLTDVVHECSFVVSAG